MDTETQLMPMPTWREPRSFLLWRKLASSGFERYPATDGQSKRGDRRKGAPLIGKDMSLDPGIGTCGKDGQSVPVGVGQPTLRIEGLTIGGTA